MQLNIIFSDLDGTLLTSEHRITRTMNSCLKKLKGKNIIRVIATGRSFYSYHRVISPGFPADYLIFSSGAGIYDLANERLLHASNLCQQDIADITAKLIQHDVDFSVHFHVPDNHRFVYYQASGDNRDFIHRIKLYRDHAVPFENVNALPETSAQIIAVLPHDIERFKRIASQFPDYQVTRTTSPLDGKSMWMEIYPPGVTKGSAAQWLCNHLHCDLSTSLGIGNDYNDIDLLECTRLSYVTANAPDELKRKYTTTKSNDEDGLYHALQEVIGTF